MWWTNINKTIKELQVNGNSFELITKLANEVYDIIKKFKKAICEIEGINPSILENNKIDFDFVSSNLKETDLLNYLLSKEFDVTVNLNKVFLNEAVNN